MVSSMPYNFFFINRLSYLSCIKMSEILVGQYIFRRLKQLGVQTVFGVPGGESSIM